MVAESQKSRKLPSSGLHHRGSEQAVQSLKKARHGWRKRLFRSAWLWPLPAVPVAAGLLVLLDISFHGAFIAAVLRVVPVPFRIRTPGTSPAHAKKSDITLVN